VRVSEGERARPLPLAHPHFKQNMAPTPAVAALGAGPAHHGGTATSSRASTPTAKQVRSSVVPFSRPAVDAEGALVGSASAPASSSLPRGPRTLSGSFSAGSSLRRPEWRPPLGSVGSSLAARAGAGAAHPLAPPASVVVAGFAPAAPDPATAGPASPARPGLLSRVLTNVPLEQVSVSWGGPRGVGRAACGPCALAARGLPPKGTNSHARTPSLPPLSSKTQVDAPSAGVPDALLSDLEVNGWVERGAEGARARDARGECE